MKPVIALRIGLFGSMAVAACAWSPGALADTLGSPVDVGDGQQWTVGNLRPSSDALPYQPAGSLWEATATSRMAGGGVPVIPGFAAQSGAISYPVLWGVASAQGINPASLPPGGSATGKIYFDVTGGAPNAVVYVSDGKEVATWVQPPPAASGAPSTYSGPRASAPAATAPAATAPAATGSSGTPAPGSSGTPLPASGSSGTPLPAEGSTSSTAPSAAAATPSTAAAPTPASTSATPAPASTSAAPAPASTSAAPATTTTAPR